MIQAVIEFEETSLLKPVAQATVPVRTESFDVATFYQTRSGLSVSDWFRAQARVISASKPVAQAPERQYMACHLKENADCLEVLMDLPKNHFSNLEDIAFFIEAQANGQEGMLRASVPGNLISNIFYLEGAKGEVFFACIGWDLSARRWRITGVWRVRENITLNAGERILCPGRAPL